MAIDREGRLCADERKIGCWMPMEETTRVVMEIKDRRSGLATSVEGLNGGIGYAPTKRIRGSDRYGDRFGDRYDDWKC